jgi:hypothetical protein
MDRYLIMLLWTIHSMFLHSFSVGHEGLWITLLDVVDCYQFRVGSPWWGALVLGFLFFVPFHPLLQLILKIWFSLGPHPRQHPCLEASIRRSGVKLKQEATTFCGGGIDLLQLPSLGLFQLPISITFALSPPIDCVVLANYVMSGEGTNLNN